MAGDGRIKETRVSPFRWKDGAKVAVVNKRTKCNGSSINDALNRGIISAADVEIMKIFKEYGYLNRNNCEKELSYRISKEDLKPDYKRNFKNMVEHGILIRYEISSDDGSRCPHAYSLSRGAYAYISNYNMLGTLRVMVEGVPEAVTDVKPLLKTLAFNQFHIAFSHEYANAISKTYINYRVKMPGCVTNINGIYRMASSKSSCGFFDVVVLCIRHYEGWREEYLAALRAVREAEVVENPLILVICEADLYVSEAEALRRSVPELRDFNVYYTSDVAYHDVPVFDYLYKVLPDKGYSTYQITKVVL